MKNSLKNDVGLLLLRVLPSVFLMTHGIPKFQKLISGDFQFGDPIGIGPTPSLFLTVIAEFICPVLLIVGFKTRWFAVPPAIVMMVAAFIVHANDGFGTQEKPLLFLVCFVLIILLGPGRYSIDKK